MSTRGPLSDETREHYKRQREWSDNPHVIDLLLESDNALRAALKEREEAVCLMAAEIKRQDQELTIAMDALQEIIALDGKFGCESVDVAQAVLANLRGEGK